MELHFPPRGFSSTLLGAALALGATRVLGHVLGVSIDPATMPRIGSVDPRFLSYNIEMAEITGGNFWKPYKLHRSTTARVMPRAGPASTPVGMSPRLYQYRPPIDLSNPRLIRLAKALGPAYVRVSGTWANSVYFSDSTTPPRKAPSGFSSVLTRREWAGVIHFVRAVDGNLVTSFATSAGTRNARGVWTPREADPWLSYTRSLGGRIAATEFMNEPTYAAMGGAPQGYDAADYGRDAAVFKRWLRKNSPGTLFLGPGSVGDGPFAITMPGMLHSSQLLEAAGPVFDVFSYHLYAAASQRCSSMGRKFQTTAAAALSPQWLSRPVKINAYYAALRNRFEPGKPLWITETADAACGGNPWAPTFLDTFRYLIEHASLAQRGVKVIMHNTLASSDYGLLDPDTFMPRPNYWASLLWRKLMGTTVLDPKLTSERNVYVYAQCLAHRPGGVALLVLNADRRHTFTLELSGLPIKRYILTARRLEGTHVKLNGHTLRLASDGTLPELRGEPLAARRARFAPLSITFLSIGQAGNPACR